MFLDARRTSALLAGVLGALLLLPAHALDARRAIGQFTHVWYENQLPQGTVLSIDQQADGAIWLATYGGLARYSGDGFETIDPRVAPALKSSAITAVSADREGGLWVGTLNGGLYRRQGRALEQVALHLGGVVRTATDAFQTLLEPAALLGIDDVGELGTDGATISLLEGLEDFA